MIFLSFSSQFAAVAMVFVSLGSNLTFLFEPTNAFETNNPEEEEEEEEGVLSLKLLGNLDKSDVFHMEMSECLRDCSHDGDAVSTVLK